jgi:nicotinamidase-related amidase
MNNAILCASAVLHQHLSARGIDMNRALLVIDVQNEYFTGALPITYPAGNLANITRVMDVAAAQGIPIVVVQHTFPNPDAPFFKRDTYEWQVHAEVVDRKHDLLIEKNFPGSFTGTELEFWLKEHNIDTVVIAGYMSHMCCDTTSRQAMHLGLTVEFLSDATGTLAVSNTAGSVSDEELHRSILVAQQMMISTVMTTDEWVDRVLGPSSIDSTRLSEDKALV